MCARCDDASQSTTKGRFPSTHPLGSVCGSTLRGGTWSLPPMPPKRARGVGQSTASDATPPLRITGGHAQLPRTIEKYRSGERCDAELVAADGTAAKAHRLVLMGASAYFEALYGASDWADATRPLQLATVPAPALKSCLEYLYTGECAVADEAGLMELLETAGYLQIESLTEATADVMSSRLSPHNCLAVWEVAERQNLEGLLTASIATACEQFTAVTAGPAWTQAPTERVHALLADDRVDASEEEVYAAAIAWLRASQHDAAAAAALLQHVRFALLPGAFVTGTVEEEPILQQFSMQKLLARAFADKLFGRVSIQTRPRGDAPGTRLVVVGGKGGPGVGADLASMECFDPATNAWASLPRMRLFRAWAGCLTGDGKVYAVGGEASGGKYLASVERFDPATNTWEVLPSMSTGRCTHGMAAVGGKIYAVGGWATGGLLSSVERFDPATNTWEALPPMSTARYALGVAAVGGKIYVVGGEASGGSRLSSVETGGRLSSVERFDPATNSWEALPPMSTARGGHGVAAVGGKIYAVGGLGHGGSCLSSVERFDPATNTRVALPSMRTARSCHGVAAVGGKIYVVGGHGDGIGYLSSVERFDPATNTWEALPSLSAARSSHGVAAI